MFSETLRRRAFAEDGQQGEILSKCQHTSRYFIQVLSIWYEARLPFCLHWQCPYTPCPHPPCNHPPCPHSVLLVLILLFHIILVPILLVLILLVLIHLALILLVPILLFHILLVLILIVIFVILMSRGRGQVRLKRLGVPHLRRLQKLRQMQGQGVWLPQ